MANDATPIYRFIQDGGRVIKDGKVNYPAFLDILISRRDAITLARDILCQLDRDALNAEEPVKVSLAGQLEQNVE